MRKQKPPELKSHVLGHTANLSDRVGTGTQSTWFPSWCPYPICHLPKRWYSRHCCNRLLQPSGSSLGKYLLFFILFWICWVVLGLRVCFVGQREPSNVLQSATSYPSSRRPPPNQISCGKCFLEHSFPPPWPRDEITPGSSPDRGKWRGLCVLLTRT